MLFVGYLDNEKCWFKSYSLHLVNTSIKTSGSTYRPGSAYIELTRENELTLEMPRCHVTKSG